jgi:CCR4-NOT transcription complex subunit 7/8
MCDDFYYKSLKTNVDNLKLIQLGITIMNEKGEYPKEYPYHTWQFNLEFDKNIEKFHPSSINLLKQSGIDFEKLKNKGINHNLFAQYLVISNLVLNPDIKWVSFQGSYDFGYLLKLLLGTDLPESEEEFINLLNLYFINYYDIRMLVKGYQNMQGGLNRLAEQLNVQRLGMIHQAGSDSMLTLDVYFKLIQGGYIDKNKLKDLKNVLHGIGAGRDNDETINYTQIGNSNYQNNNNNNMMNVNMTPINTNYWNVNMNYFNYPIMINGQST